ncbi:MAG: DNA-deoxyinosine glycosylase [Chloroflexi bacterium]|nr:DNA-deoxyinosine glycosylase [Chloroflexota bacterium]
MKQSFPPLITENSRILILGTMPGEESLRRQEYYANPRNQFWRIIGEIFQTDLLELTYSARAAFLIQQGLALWDVLESCERSSSLDRDINNRIPNNFQALFETYRNIQVLVFNGQLAHKWFKQSVVQQQALEKINRLQKVILPSTSPAATVALSEKIRQWSVIKKL